MKKTLKVSLFAIVTMMTSASYGASATGEARINFQEPLSISEITSVDFGTVSPDGAGILSMGTDGVVTCPSNFICTEATSVGEFDVTGKPNTIVFISIDQSAKLTTGGIPSCHPPNPCPPVSLYKTINFEPTLSQPSINLDENGLGQVLIGGTLSIIQDQSSGVYSTTGYEAYPYMVKVLY